MTDDYFDKDGFRVPREDAIFVSVEAYDALAARLAEAERLLSHACERCGECASWYPQKCTGCRDIEAFLTGSTGPAGKMCWCGAELNPNCPHTE